MQNLLKFTLLTLISLITLNAVDFGENEVSGGRNNSFSPCGDSCTRNEISFISSKYVKIDNDVYEITASGSTYFNTENLKDSPGYLFLHNSKSSGIGNTHRLYYYSNSFEKRSIVCKYNEQSKSLGNCSYSYQLREGYKQIEVSYYYTYVLSGPIAKCQANENFNTETKQCQKCPEGHSWDAENNMCWQDCTNMIKNKWGFSNGTPQGICIDCSGEKTLLEAADCACRSLGFGGSNFAGRFENHSNYPKCAYDAECKVEKRQIRIYDPSCKEEKEPKPDDNNTNPKDPDNPKDPKDPKDPNNPKDPKNPNDPGKDNNDPNNPNPNGPKPDQDSEFCKKNPTDPKCKKKDNNNTNPKGPGGGGPSGDNDNKDKDAKFDPKDFDFKDLEKDVNDFKSKYSDALDTISNSFTNIKQGIDQFIANVQGKGMNGITKKNVPTTCPHIYTIDFNGYPSELNFDFCKVVSPASGAFYHLFYVIFFLGFLMLIVKLLILSF